VRLLLDTNVVIWMLGVSSKLPPNVRETLSDPRNVLFVSTSTIHEMAIKVSIGKLRVPDGFPQSLADRGCTFLPPGVEDAWQVASLPLLHRDPFDRLIVAQAMMNRLTLVTSDRQLADYGVPVILI
jgi:PIN domain nuclease of toxin-antitoxin system